MLPLSVLGLEPRAFEVDGDYGVMAPRTSLTTSEGLPRAVLRRQCGRSLKKILSQFFAGLLPQVLKLSAGGAKGGHRAGVFPLRRTPSKSE